MVILYFFWVFLVLSTYAHCDKCKDKHKIFTSGKQEHKSLYVGKCQPPQSKCPPIDQPICAIPKASCGKPKTLKNFCKLHKLNSSNKGAEYEFYHDGSCNDVNTAITDNCENCECEDKIEQVCAISADFCGKPETVLNYCKLQKLNCDRPEKQLLYFHEGHCLTDK